ncbi:DUF397 domain-containing protein [Streptomyces sp. NPDC007905]|uniref:DUF397 domain-containing protein n=1 Tax=Streptomyces sp. NPDC007905 TaxID=3364788 RepID=UPI0036E3BB86
MNQGLQWRKSSYSATATTCVEIAQTSAVVWIRDSKDVTKSPLRISTQSWKHFQATVRSCEQNQ